MIMIIIMIIISDLKLYAKHFTELKYYDHDNNNDHNFRLKIIR